MLKIALALVVFLFISQAYSQDALLDENQAPLAMPVQVLITQETTSLPAAPVQAAGPSTDEKMEALQQQLLMLQNQMTEMKQVPVAPAQVIAPVPVIAPVAPTLPAAEPQVQKLKQSHEGNASLSELRGRKQSMTWRYAYIYQKHKITTSNAPGSITTDSNRTEFEFEYALNLALIEGGVRFIGAREEDDDGAEIFESNFALVGRLNFIENHPGNDFIPYLAGYLGGIGVKISSSTSSATLDGGYVGIGLGFNWFPFSEIFALNLELAQYSAGLESDTYPKVSSDTINTRLNVGWRVYF